jgi:hypothetical protein
MKSKSRRLQIRTEIENNIKTQDRESKSSNQGSIRSSKAEKVN